MTDGGSAALVGAAGPGLGVTGRPDSRFGRRGARAHRPLCNTGIAVAEPNTPIGVDLEPLDRDIDVASLAAVMLAPEEACGREKGVELIFAFTG